MAAGWSGLKTLVLVVVLALVVLVIDFYSIGSSQSTDQLRSSNYLPPPTTVAVAKQFISQPLPIAEQEAGADAPPAGHATERRGPHTEVDCRERGSFCIYTNLCYDGEKVPPCVCQRKALPGRSGIIIILIIIVIVIIIIVIILYFVA
jgi:uncharacterized membrane protein